jgi:hypothetical protein
MSRNQGSLTAPGLLRRLGAVALLLVPALAVVVLGPEAFALTRKGDSGALDARAFTPATEGGPAALSRKATTIPGNTGPGADEVEVRLTNWEATLLPSGSPQR